MKRTKLPATLLLLVFFLVLPVSAGAHTVVTETFRCPVDGTRFTADVDASGTSFGERLDRRPLGPTPAPWALPVCPKCHFVLYADAGEFDRKLKRKLRSFVQSEEYQALAKEHSPYFLLARIFEFLGEDDWEIAYAYLQASWEVEDEPERYQAYLRSAHDACDWALEKDGLEREDRIGAHFLAGELDRQLGDFNHAEAHFQSLEVILQPSDDEVWQRLVHYERRLIDAGDSAPRQAPGPGEEDDPIEPE